MKENGAWLFENNHFGENGLTNDINIDRVLPKLDFRHLQRISGSVSNEKRIGYLEKL
jgi:hypothetical protein